jgi:hypothetical protein
MVWTTDNCDHKRSRTYSLLNSLPQMGARISPFTSVNRFDFSARHCREVPRCGWRIARLRLVVEDWSVQVARGPSLESRLVDSILFGDLSTSMAGYNGLVLCRQAGGMRNRNVNVKISLQRVLVVNRVCARCMEHQID